MKTIDIQAFEDRSRPSGGHAVICLVGVAAIVRNSAFVLRPLDGTLDDHEREHWPKGEQTPIETRASETGIELVVGPGLVDNPLLVPGTPVMIDLPHEGVSGEFLWPSVAMPSRPRRRSVLTPSASQYTETQRVPASQAAEEPRPRRGATTSAQVATAPLRGSRAIGDDDAPARATRAPDEEDTVFYTSARGAAPTASETGSAHGMNDIMPKSRAGAAIVAVAALLAVQATAYALMTARRPADLTREATAVARIETPLFDALTTGLTSPGGASAARVAPARMLELAHTNLAADGANRNTDEAAFWLKRYITTAAADDRARRALTQLGSAFAMPSRGMPDYTNARLVWEMAAAQGDPIAMCFIAKLYDSGLGGAQDKTAARRWNELAQPHGGCADTR